MFRWLVDRLSTLALALILALIVWFVAVQETNPIVEELYGEPVPIRLLNQPAGTVHISSSGLVLPDEPKEYLQVTVRGPRQTLAALEPASFKAMADLTGVALGGDTVPVTVTIDEPLVEIIGQDVAEIPIRLEEYRTITLPVVTDIVGEPALGHVAGAPLVEPSEVSLEGPASRVDPLSQAVVRVSIEGVRETVKETTLAQLRDVNNRLVVGFDSNQLQVSVTVPVTKSDEYAELFVTVNITGSIATGYRLADFSVEPQRVTIFGPPEVVQALPGFISTLPIDVSEADSDLIQRVGLVVPAGLTQVGAQSVLVEIDVEPVLTTLTVPWRPTIVGPDEGLAATISPEIVNISLTGPIGQMDIFDPDSDLALTLNLYGMLPGSYQVELVPLSNVLGVTVESVLPPSVQVEVYALPTPTPTPTITTTIAFTGTVTPGLTLTPIPSPLGTPTPTDTP